MGTSLVTWFRHALLPALLAAGAAEAQTYSTWAHARHIFFNTASGGANIAGNVSDFPVLVRLNSGNFDFGQALPAGEDIRFEDPDGTPLYYQVESWDNAGQSAEIWVRVPQIDGNSTQDRIRMYWGKAGASSESNPAAVFATGSGFAGAWHLQEDGGTAASHYLDASGNAYHGTGTSMTTASDVAAVSAKGSGFNGTSQSIDFGDGADLNPTSGLTLEAWVNAGAMTPNAPFLSKAFTSSLAPNHQYFLGMDGAGSKFQFSVAIGGTRYDVSTTTTPSTNTWYHVAGRYDGSTLKIFLNGVEEGSLAQSGALSTYSQTLILGKYAHYSTYFDGILDEPRVSGWARPAEWLRLAYQNQMPAGSTFLEWGPRVWDGGGADAAWSNPLNWNGDVTPSADEHVVFNSSSGDDVTLDGNVSVHSITLNSGYAGTFSFSSHFLTVLGGTADFRSGGPISPGSGGLILSCPNPLNLYPKNGGSLPAITLNGAGGATVNFYDLNAAGLTLSNGDFNLGGRNLAVTGDLSVNGGSLTPGTSTVDVDGNLVLTSGTLNCPIGNLSIGGSLTQSGGTLNLNSGTLILDANATGKTLSVSSPLYNLTLNGSGGAYSLGADLSVTGALTVTAGTLNTSSHNLSLGSLTINGGALSFGSGSLSVSGNLSMSSGTFTLPGSGQTFQAWGNFIQTGGTLHANGGTLTLPANSPGRTLTALGSLNTVTFNGSGGAWTLATHGLTATTLNLVAGSLDLGAGLTHSVTQASLGAGSLSFGSSTLKVSGNTVNFNGLSSLTAGTGVLEFTNASATVFTPKASTTHPGIRQTGPGYTTVAAADLTAASLEVTDGTFDLSSNSLGLTVQGALTVSGGILDLRVCDVYVTGDLTLSATGTLNAPQSGKVFYVGEDLSYSGSATLNPNSGTLILNSASTGRVIDAIAGLHHLVINGSGSSWTTARALNLSGTLTLSAGSLSLSTNGHGLMAGGLAVSGGTLTSGGADLDINGDLSFTIGTLECPGSGKSFTVTGNVSHTGGTLTPNGGTLLLDGASVSKSLALLSALDNLTVNGPGSTWSAQSHLNVTGTFTLAAGTLDNSSNITTLSAGNFVQTGGTLSSNTGDVDVVGNFTQTGGTFTAPGGVRQFTVGGNFSQTGGTFTPGTGKVTLDGAVTGRTFNSATTQNALDLVGSGEWTVTANPLNTGSLSLSAGTLKLGSGLVNEVTGALSLSGGTLDFETGTLRVHASAVNFNGLSAMVAGSGTLEFMGASAKTLTPKSGASHPSLKLTGSATVTLASYNLTTQDILLNGGALDLDARSAVVNGNLVLAGGSLVAANGSLDVNGNISATSGTLALPSGSMTLAGSFTKAAGATLQHNSGTVFLDGGSPGKILDIHGGDLSNLSVSGSGGVWTVTNNALSVAGTLSLSDGTLHLGAALNSSAGSLYTAAAGALNFGSSTLAITSGDATFTNLGTLIPGSGTLSFTAPTGTQTLFAKSAATQPHVTHTGAGTLRLNNASLSCLSFTNSAGTLDFNNYNLTTEGSGNFTVNNGNASTFSGLAGRVITVAGNAAFNGVSNASRLNLDGGALWYLNVTGASTAQFASVSNSTAAGGSTAVCSNCANLGSNTNWSFAVTWDGGGSDANWSTAANWGSDFVPSDSDDVTFDATSTDDATLDVAASVRSIHFAAGYTGAFSFAANTLTINSGNADFRSGGAISAGSGTLAFTSPNAQTFIPKAGATFPAIVQNGNTGVTTVTTHSLTAGNLTLTSGTFHLGASLNHTVAGISGSGGLNFGTSNLSATGNVNLGNAVVAATATNTLSFTGSSAQTYTPNLSEPDLNLVQNGTGGTIVSTYAITAPALTISTGTLDLGTGHTHTLNTIAATGGGLDFGASTLRLMGGGTVDMTGLATLTAGSGTLAFNSGASQTFIPKASHTYPAIAVWSSDVVTLSTHNLTAGALHIGSGTLNLGAGLAHSVTSLGSDSASLHFNSSTLRITSGDANLGGLSAVTPATGTLEFTSASGTQIFTPKSGASHPVISHTGAGELELGSHDLSCLGFSQTAGSLDLAGRNLTTTSGGNFTVTNAVPTTFLGLGGRTITVAGNASIAGTSGASRANLNAASPCTLAVSGTLSASLASLGNSHATVTSGSCANCANVGNNIGWTVSVAWDGGAGTTSWKNPTNWYSDYLPAAGDDVVFNSGAADATLDSSVTVKSITFTGGYMGLFSFGTQNLSVTGDADFRSGGPIAAGTGNLIFAGSGAQTFIPRSGATFPNISQNGPGTTTVSTHGLTAGNLSLAAGTFHLGTSLNHTMASVAGSGALNFGTSNLNATSSVNLASATVTASTANTLAFIGAANKSFTPNASVTGLNLTQNGAGATTVAANAFTTPLLTVAAGFFNLGSAAKSHLANGVSFTGGGLGFGSCTLSVSAATVNFSALDSVVNAAGRLRLTGASAQTFTPKAGYTHPGIIQAGTGGTTLAANLSASSLSLITGAFNLGNARSHTLGSLATAGGALDFSSSTLNITNGDVDFSGLATLTAGTGTLGFIGSTGTRNLTPKSGQTHPALVHSGTDTLRLAANPLTCASFTQSAGALNFNSLDLTTVAGGDFIVHNGGPMSLVGLGGRTLTVGGNAAFNGLSSGTRIGLNPTAAWTAAVTGSLTANLATLDSSLATGSAGTCTNCAVGPGNVNWNSAVAWDNGAGTGSWKNPLNWGSDMAPTGNDDVIFNATSADATLDTNATVKSITFTSGFTGAFSFSGSLSVKGHADFRSGGAVTASSGSLAFIGTGAQTFIPKSGGTFPDIIQNGNAGTTTVTSNALAAGKLTVSLGTFHLGASLNHTVGDVSGSGGLHFGSSGLSATGHVDLSALTVTASSNTLTFANTVARSFTPHPSLSSLNLAIAGTAAVTVATHGFTVPSLAMGSGSLVLGSGLTHAVTAALSLTGGTLDFNSGTLQAASATVDLRGLGALAGTGNLVMTGSTAQTLHPKASTQHPNLRQNGPGGTTLASNAMQGGALIVDAGTLDLGSGFTHDFTQVTSAGGGLAFNNSTLRLAGGGADLSGLAALSPGAGTLAFTAPSGIQVFTPKASAAHPAIVHSGAGTLQLATHALSAASFSQTAGTLDLGGQNLSTTGDFTVAGGTASSFNALAGRTLTVGGNASFTGQAGNLVNLNPASAWTLAVTGALSATLAQIANNTAGTTAGDATSSVDGGGNVNWGFSVTWDGGGADDNWTTGANWSSDAVPAASSKVIFDATSVKDCILDGAATVKTLIFGTGYTGTFAFATNTLYVTGNADFRGSGGISAGTGTLAFAGSAAQSFYPMAGATFPAITQNGAGGTTLGAHPLTAGALNVLNGTFALGAGLSHAVASLGGTGGGLAFGSSTLKVSGNADVSSLALVDAGTGRLEFTGSGSQTFTPKAGATHPMLVQAGSGSTTVSTHGFTAAGLRVEAGAFNLGAGLTHAALDSLKATGGALDFGSSTLRTGAAAPTLAGLATLTPGTGTLEFNGGSAQAFTGKVSVSHPALLQSGAGGTTLASSLNTGGVTLVNGTLALGTGLNHLFASLSATAGGLDFGSSALSVPGAVNLGGLGTLAAGTGTLAFTAATGTQVFTPRNGVVHPMLTHPGAGALQLDVNDLTAKGLSQTGGPLDLNGRNITLVGSGNLDVTGTGAVLSGLAGRTLSVGGSAFFRGAPGVPIDLNPASAWTLAVTGSLRAVDARIRNSAATVSFGVADSSLDLGGNSGWTFVDSIKPDNVDGFLATATGGTKVALAWTPSVSEDADSVMLRYRTDGTYPVSRTDGILWRSVAAAKAVDTATGLSDKSVFWFAAFVKDSSGNYSAVSAGARDSARTPDVTPPANVTSLAASGLSPTAAALDWVPSGAPDADSLMIRYRPGLVHPADPTDGSLWKTLPVASDKDTVTGLLGNTVYAFSLFVRDSSGNYSPATASARDTSLWQLPITGSVAVQDMAGLTRDGDPALAFAWSGADSLRFSRLADTAAATWKDLRALDSTDLGAGDGKKIVAVQFKNLFGRRSAWFRDTTTMDRQPPAVTLDLKDSLGRWTWPVALSGLSKDTVSGTDRVFVIRRRLSDDHHFNGSAWVAGPDTAKLSLSPTDTLFSASMPAASLATGDYQFTAYARDRAGNEGAPVTRTVHFEENRLPAFAFGNLPDTVLQNRAGSFKLDFGDLDAGDSLVPVSFDAPAWLTAAPGPDTAWAPWALHKTYALAGKPLQAHVGAATVQVRLQDKGGLILTYAKPIFVVDVNDAPVFNDSQDTYSVKEDSVSRWSVKFRDEDAQDVHTLSMLAGPAFAKVENLTVVLRPGSRDVGVHPLTLTVGDGELLDTLETAVTVVNVNDPPYAFPSDGWRNPFFFKEDRPDSFSVVVVDMDKDEPVVLATQIPAYLKMSVTVDSTGYNRTFRFQVHPKQADTGSLNLGMVFMDIAHATSNLALVGKVLPHNDTPTAAITEPRTHAGAARFRLSVQDEDGSLEKARFHYRLVNAAGDTLRRGITPSSQLALHPLADGDYKLAIRAEDQDGLQQPAFTVQPFTVSGATTLFLDSARWHMVGVPQLSLPASALGQGAVLAAWDETTDDGQPMARYSSGKTVEALRRGKGYWAKLLRPATVKAHQDDLLQGPFILKLTHGKQGWNQVANPYPYWVDVSASRLTFWEWDAEKRDLVNARGLLKPWAAYWVMAPKDTTLVLADQPYFPPAEGALAKRAASHHRGQWSLQLALRAGAYHDAANLMGIGAATGAGDPATALADAPKFGEYIALHFEKQDSAAQGYATDFRSELDPEEEWWDFSVENAGSGESQALLQPSGLEALASAGLKLFLVRQGEARQVEAGAPAVLSMEGGKTHYSLVVTPHADFASRLKGNFSISQNFPNPVTTFTAFRFFLPQSWDEEGKRVAKDFKLRINVYDYSGRQVAQAASGTFRPGSHTLLWKPASPGGGPLAKGAYIYRLEVPGFAKSMKLVVE